MKIFGLVGYPLTHSFSPQYFAEKFQKENIDAEYKAFPLNDISEIEDLVNSQPRLKGFNVTVPYKESITKYLTRLEGVAADLNVVNTVTIERNPYGLTTVGHNTDEYGFRTSIEPLLEESSHKSAMILGTGGTSKTIQYVLNKKNIETYHITRGLTDIHNQIINYRDITKELMKKTTLIINTTPLGMFPDTHNLPDIPYEFIAEEHIMFDVIYNPSRTLFLEEGMKRGATTKNGYEMLVLQAEKSWQIWQSHSG